VAKVTINGEIFDYDPSRKPMTEALEIERALKCKYTEWENDLTTGSMRALCGFIWIIWHRDGRDISIEDILSGKAEINLNEVSIEPDGDEPDPTSLSPDPSSMTGSGTSGSSPRSSGSGRGRSGSSSRTSSSS
jgi:hypothetical protein